MHFLSECLQLNCNCNTCSSLPANSRFVILTSPPDSKLQHNLFKVCSLPPFWACSLNTLEICLIRKGYIIITPTLSISHLSSTVLQPDSSCGSRNHPFHPQPQPLPTWCHTPESVGHGAHEQMHSGLRSSCSFPWSLSHECRFQFCSSASDTSSLCLQ